MLLNRNAFELFVFFIVTFAQLPNENCSQEEQRYSYYTGLASVFAYYEGVTFRENVYIMGSWLVVPKGDII